LASPTPNDCCDNMEGLKYTPLFCYNKSMHKCVFCLTSISGRRNKIYCSRQCRASFSKSKRWHTLCKGARNRKLDFQLTRTDFVEITNSKNPCFYCGRTFNVIGIDRYDNNIGYIKTNCVPCCKECNFLKGSRNAVLFIQLCQRIGQHNRQSFP
jgi:hypothetical protein